MGEDGPKSERCSWQASDVGKQPQKHQKNKGSTYPYGLGNRLAIGDGRARDNAHRLRLAVKLEHVHRHPGRGRPGGAWPEAAVVVCLRRGVVVLHPRHPVAEASQKRFLILQFKQVKWREKGGGG